LEEVSRDLALTITANLLGKEREEQGVVLGISWLSVKFSASPECEMWRKKQTNKKLERGLSPFHS